VPRSIDDPLHSNAANVDGFLNVLVAARDAKVKRFVYAASSAAYGDDPGLPKVEDTIGEPLSPYAVTKVVNEMYARVFQSLYGIECVGLRYFNVFGPRQDPDGAYAAVIPRWVGAMLRGQPCEIYGDGETSRDFCFVENAVRANLLAATAPAEATGQVYNVACASRTTLRELFELIRTRVRALRPQIEIPDVAFRDERAGDVRHSLADISKARRLLGYEAEVSVPQGLDATVRWFVDEDPRLISPR
jgi:UDP-N-acetylglucosamine 4-epimerase